MHGHCWSLDPGYGNKEISATHVIVHVAWEWLYFLRYNSACQRKGMSPNRHMLIPELSRYCDDKRLDETLLGSVSFGAQFVKVQFLFQGAGCSAGHA